MADSFQQRIELQGAEDIIKNLQQIGSEATKAIGQLKTAVTSANPALAALSTTSLAAQNAMKGFGASVAQATTVIAPFSASLSGLLGVFGAFAGPAGILAAAGGLAVFLKHTADSVVDINRQASALGLSIEQFKALSKVAKDAGVSQEQVTRSLTQVAQQVAAQARQQLGGIADILKEVVSGNIPGLAGQGILSKIIKLDDINKLKGVIASIIPDLRAFAEAADLKEQTIKNEDQFAAAMLNVARSATPAGEALRKLLAVAANADTAITPIEKISEQLVKSENSLTSLRLSFLNGNAAALDLFNSLLKLSDQLSKLPAGPAKTALERNIAGRFGPEVLTALQDTKGIAEELQKQLEKIGINTQAVTDAKELIKAFNDLDKAGKAAGNSLLLAFGPSLSAGLRSLSEDIASVKQALSDLFAGKFSTKGVLEDVEKTVVDDLDKFFKSVGVNWDKLKDLFKEPIAPPASFSERFGDIKDVEPLAEEIKRLTDAGSQIGSAFASIDTSGLTTLSTAATTALAPVQQLTTAGTAMGPEFQSAGSQATSAFQGLTSAIQTANSEMQTLLSNAQQLASINLPSGGGGGGEEFARGGMIWGPGSGTSDSILARLSRGEFVIQAAAVQHYGPQLMAALNAMRLPRLPGFSLGGLADGLGRTLRANLAIPGMAAGGLTPAPAKANTVPITLDLRTDRGRFRGSAMADREVAEALSRFAVLDQITSMGKKSGAY